MIVGARSTPYALGTQLRRRAYVARRETRTFDKEHFDTHEHDADE